MNRLLLAALLGAAVAAACAGGSESDVADSGSKASQSSTVDPSTAANETIAQTTPRQSDMPEKAVDAVTPSSARVELLEYQIRLPQTLAAGKQSLSVANAGTEQHAFEIEGNGVHVATQKLSAGSTTQLDVDLKPGTYTVYCPVDKHKDQGMKTTLTIQ